MNRRKYAFYDLSSRNDYEIPGELGELLRLDSYSLLIKGSPGSGKTTLALTILRELEKNQKDNNFLYVSTRASQKQIFQSHPWLSEFFQIHFDRQEATRIETSRGGFVDARLDEQSALFETITNELMESDAPLIIIDSWDAIGNFMDREAELTSARVLQTWRERTGAKLILVGEGREVKALDFLMDGIATLSQTYVDGRLLRRLLLSKMHGVKIARPSYFFTLNNGIFRSFEPYRPSEFGGSKSSKNDGGFYSDADMTFESSDFISTGHGELDRSLGGGFPARTVAKIRLGPRIDGKVVLALLERMTDGHLRRGNPMVFQPLAGIDAEQMNFLLKFHREQERDGHLKILQNNEEEEKETEAQRGTNVKKSKIDLLKDSILEIRKAFPDKKLIAILERDEYRIAEEAGSKMKQELKSLARFLRSHVDLSVMVSRRHGDDAESEYEQLSAETILRICAIEGTLFLKCEMPYSQFFALVPKPKNAIEEGLRLEPIL